MSCTFTLPPSCPWFVRLSPPRIVGRALRTGCAAGDARAGRVWRLSGLSGGLFGGDLHQAFADRFALHHADQRCWRALL
jgi:hypothetical protein